MIVKCWADFGCFTRADTRTQPVSYPIIPPSAARGLLRSVYWKPQFHWVIKQIDVLAPIRFTTLKVTGRKDGQKGHTLVQMLVLEAPAYQLHIDVTPNPSGIDGEVPHIGHVRGKHLSVVERRLERGQYFRPPYMGVRDFTAHLELVDAPDEPIDETRPVTSLPLTLGWHEEDGDYKTDPTWFDGIIEDGSLHVPDPDEIHD